MGRSVCLPRCCFSSFVFACLCFVGSSGCLLFLFPLLCSLSDTGVCAGSITQILPVLFEFLDLMFPERSFPIGLSYI